MFCAHDTAAFIVVQCAYEGGLILLGCYLAFKTRNLADEFGESEQLAIAMYNIALVSSVVLVIVNTVDVTGATSRVLVTIAIVWSTMFSSGVFILPRLLTVRDRGREVAVEQSTEPTSVDLPLEGS